MTEKKFFCDECRKDVSYTIEYAQMKSIIKGAEYSYFGKIARCADCNSEIYVEEVNDYNLKALYDKYREKHGLVALDVILKIPEKYAIGKRPLSLLLGWGEHTFSRYYDGDIPSRQYSEILQKIYDDPNYYKQILESNKKNLKSEGSYEKSKKAVDKLIDCKIDRNDKITLATKYLLSKCEDMTPLALQKALYYIQGFYYAFYKTFLFPEDCQAWIHGPVYKEVYYKYRDYKCDPITYHDQTDDILLSSSEKAIFDSVVKYICCYSGKVLEKLTHLESPWLSARGDLNERIPSDRIISKQSIGDYFSSVKDKYNMLTPNDIKEYTQIMFQKI